MLENKPIHHDEAVNAWWLTQISELGYFPYDPTNYHGPLYFYVQWFFNSIFGDELWVLRAGAVFFSALTVGLLYKKGYRWGALAMSLSPAFFFFSRSAIHESMFVFFQVVMLLGFLDWVQEEDRGLELFLLGLFGSFAVKETWALSFISLIVAFLATKSFPRQISFRPVLVAFAAWLIIFTGFFQDFSGALNFFKAFMPWLNTGTAGSGHDKAFLFWLEQIFRYETLFLFVALMAGFILLKKRASRKFCFIFIFTLLQLLIYSLIPYKTIWCLIAILWPLCLLADETANEFMAKCSYRKWIFLFSMGLMAWQSVWIYKLNFQNPISFDHPYVYVQTSQAVKTFAERVSSQWNVLVVRKDVWPFPWIFRKNQNLRYLSQNADKGELESLMTEVDIVISDLESSDQVTELAQGWKKEMFYLRDGANEVFVFQRNP